MHIYNFPLSLKSVLLIYTNKTYIYVLFDTLLTLDYNALKNSYLWEEINFLPPHNLTNRTTNSQPQSDFDIRGINSQIALISPPSHRIIPFAHPIYNDGNYN